MSDGYPFAAVLFDLDGVVIDTTALHYRVWDEFARARGIRPTEAELLATNGRRADDIIRSWIGPDLDERAVAALTDQREALFHQLLATEPVATVPGVEAFIASLKAKGIPLAIATSAVPANAALSLSRLGLQGAFRAVITAADVHRGKPDPQTYIAAAAALGVSAAESVVIEDSVPGIRSARAAGARCVALTTTFPREALAAERPDWLVADFRELPGELRP